MRLFLGKFSRIFPEQIEGKFYAGGDKGSGQYGDVKEGDYIFVSHGGKIIGLWKAKEYTEMKNTVVPDRDGVLLFDLVKEYKDVSVTNDFTKYKYFIHNLDLVNKVTKSTKGLGFIPIETRDGCPSNPVDIDFKSGVINLYIALEDLELNYKDGDVRVRIDNLNDMNIISIDRFTDGEFKIYEELNRLYEERNTDEGKYTIRELNDLALKDQATNKRSFLTTLIEELESNGYMKVSNAVRLYDNLLVGRKKSGVSKTRNLGSGSDSLEDENEDDDWLDENSQYYKLARLLNFNPNLILYGPPGTGKTYGTRKIIDHYERKYFKDASSYQKAESENRVKTITFHQSYSYEEFIEGIRPILNSDQAGEIGYKLENGLFKEICINAEKELIKREDNAKYIDMINSGTSIWKVSLGERKNDDIFDQCIKEGDIAIGWLDHLDLSNMNYDDVFQELRKEDDSSNHPTQNASSINSFINNMAMGDIILVYDGPETIRMIGIVKSGYRYDSKFDYKHRRRVEWFKDLNYPIKIHSYNGYKNLTQKTIYELTRISITDVIEMVVQNSPMEKSSQDKPEVKPYYMIIDEINRGNISKIFGELITLIEQDKRGKLKSLLPYSKKEFSVPANLFIIGTMNTADRSIAVIDTALRRRFTFAEIEPNSEVLAQDENPIINDTIDLGKLLDAINIKIMDKYNRDHRIGHAYFMGMETLNDFYQNWYYKILPLLCEYFYNDVETLKFIVGESFYDKYGNINYLPTAPQDRNLSEFEENILKIYKVNDNG